MTRVGVALLGTALLCLVLAGCNGRGGRSRYRGGSGAPDGSGSTETYRPSATGTRSTSAPEGTTTVTCASSEQCDYWFCRCEDGALVNAAFCLQGYCADDAVACTDACAHFRHGEWVSTAGGGPDGGSSGGSDRTSIPPGDEGASGGADTCGRLGDSIGGECGGCVEGWCCGEADRCVGNTDCTSYVGCMQDCDGSSFCEDGCQADFPSGASLWNALEGCVSLYCPDVCET